MPQHKQFKKALKVNEKARIRNKALKSKMRTFVKKVHTASSQEEAQTLFRTATSIIDTSARKGVIKKETAARQKSRLSKFITRMGA